MKTMGMHIAIAVVFFAVALTLFARNTVTPESIGLFASGIAVGASLAKIVVALQAKQKTG